MSVFDQNNEQEKAVNLLDSLVGEGQKYKTAEDLAKGYANADKHIATLTQELKELREKNESAKNITDAVNNKNSNDEVNKNSTPANINDLSKEELIELMKGVMNEDKTMNVHQSNLSQVDEFFTNKFGDKAGQEVARIAQVNGMTLEQLKNLSTTSPQAVINLAGGAEKSYTQTSTFTSTVNTAANTETIKGNSYYSKMRKEDPKKFYSRDMQKEMRDSIAALGNDFMNN